MLDHPSRYQGKRDGDNEVKRVRRWKPMQENDPLLMEEGSWEECREKEEERALGKEKIDTLLWEEEVLPLEQDALPLRQWALPLELVLTGFGACQNVVT